MRTSLALYGFFFPLLLLTGCARQQPATTLNEMNIRGKVKSVTTTLHYDIKEENGQVLPAKHRAPNSCMLFNKAGMVIEHVRFDADSTIRSIKRYHYDTDNRLVEEAEYFSSGEPRFRYLFHYSADGREVTIEEFNYTGGGYSSFEKKEKYDAKGRLLERSSYSFRAVYRYDKEGELLERSSYALPADTLVVKTTYIYNKKGQAIEMITKHTKPELSNRALFKYDENGNINKVMRYDVDNNPKNTTHIRFEYDKKENIIKRIEYLDSTLQYMAIRKIEYY